LRNMRDGFFDILSFGHPPGVLAKSLRVGPSGVTVFESHRRSARNVQWTE